MSQLASGTYYIGNASWGNNVDLQEANVVPGTPVIGYHFDTARNQKWVVNEIDGKYTIRSLVFPTAFAAPILPINGQTIVSGAPTLYEIVQVEGNQYTINVADTDLYWVLSEPADNTKIQLQFPGSGDVWTFTPV